MSFTGSTILQTPGLSWKGIRNEATRELATRIDPIYMNALRLAVPREFWGPFVSYSDLAEGEEIVKFPLNLEDLEVWKPRTGARVARGVKDLLYARGLVQPYYQDREIATSLLKRGAFGDFPDRFAAMMIAARRTIGTIFRDALFSTGASGTSSKLYTYQGGLTGTQPLIYPSGHYCDPANPLDSYTFGNLHTGADQSASGKALAVKGATTLNAAGWEAIQKEYMTRPGPGGVPLDAAPTFVLGGARMGPVFKRLWKRVLVLEDSASGPAAAAVSNIHNQDMPSLREMWEEPVIPVVSGWLDYHPYAIANPTAQQFWTMSTTYPARPFGIALGDGGNPRVKVLDIGSEYETLHDAIYIKGDMDLGIVGLFPHIFDEWRST